MTISQSEGHGWVLPRADGVRARCGGPTCCPICRAEQEGLRPAVAGMRRKVLQISDCLLPSFLGMGPHAYEVIKDGIPEGGRIVGAMFDAFGCGPTLKLVIESGTFDVVPNGMPYPEIMPILKSIETATP